MKMLLAAALLASLSATAHAVHSPNAVDKTAMDLALAAARAANTDRLAMLQHYNLVNNRYAGYSATEIQKAESAWRLAENKRDKAANAALAAVAVAYDIHPDKSTANAAAG
jgi:hypothetical protein